MMKTGENSLNFQQNKAYRSQFLMNLQITKRKKLGLRLFKKKLAALLDNPDFLDKIRYPGLPPLQEAVNAGSVKAESISEDLAGMIAEI